MLSQMLYSYRSMIANGFAAIAIVGIDGTIKEVNDKFTDLFGYKREEIVGCHTRTLRSGGTSPETYKGLWGSVLKGQSWQGEVQNKRKDGTRVWVNSSISSVNDDAGRIEAFIVVYHDIEHLRQAQNIRRDADVAAAKEDVLRGTIHNIANVQTLLQGAHASEMALIKSMLQSINVAAKHLETLDPAHVKSFMLGALDVVRISAIQIQDAANRTQRGVQEVNAVIQSCRQQIHNTRPIVERVRVRDFLNEILSPVMPEMTKHGIAVSYNSIPEEDYADWQTNNVRQIIHNLVKNAQESITDNGVKNGRVVIDIDDADKGFCVSVSDNGGGIAPEVIDKLFRQGYTTKENGSGIGLHNSANLARRMGGSLSVHQITEPAGAKFSLYLPA